MFSLKYVVRKGGGGVACVGRPRGDEGVASSCGVKVQATTNPASLRASEELD